jgi:hypothetical protein
MSTLLLILNHLTKNMAPMTDLGMNVRIVINKNIVESGVKHYKPNQTKPE